MKKKVVALALPLSLLLGGVAGASIYHITDERDRLQDEYTIKADSFKRDIDQRIKADTMDETQSEIERMRIESNDYFNKVAGQYYQDKLNEKSQAIEAETNRSIEELKVYIDSLFVEEQ